MSLSNDAFVREHIVRKDLDVETLSARARSAGGVNAFFKQSQIFLVAAHGTVPRTAAAAGALADAAPPQIRLPGERQVVRARQTYDRRIGLLVVHKKVVLK